MFTFPSEKSRIHLGLWGLSTSWRCTADSQTLEWKVLPSHKDCSWSTTVPIQLRMPKKKSGTKDIFVEQNGLSSVKHKASADYTHLWQFENVTISLLFWKATINNHIYPLTSKIPTIWPPVLAAESLRKYQYCFLAERTLFWKHNSSQRKVHSMPY